MQNRFWDNKKLSDFTEEEWESVCTNCGRCCLIKLQDDDTEEIYYTDVVCRYFDQQNCRCSEYAKRCQLVPACLKLTPQNIDQISWMPQECAYRRLKDSRGLPDWHPLLTGKNDSSHSIKDHCISEDLVSEDQLEDHIIEEEDL